MGNVFHAVCHKKQTPFLPALKKKLILNLCCMHVMQQSMAMTKSWYKQLIWMSWWSQLQCFMNKAFWNSGLHLVMERIYSICQSILFAIALENKIQRVFWCYMLWQAVTKWLSLQSGGKRHLGRHWINVKMSCQLSNLCVKHQPLLIWMKGYWSWNPT